MIQFYPGEMNWDDECDVLVVGSGGGGCTGAYTAARAGQSVLLVEATDKFGGVTAYSGGGGAWFPCSAPLRRAGQTDDTIEAAKEYQHAVVGDRVPTDLQDAFVTGGAPLVDYLEEDPILQFQMLPWADYFGAAPHARSDGRVVQAVPLPASELGAYRETLRGWLGQDWLGMDHPEELLGGQALIGRLLLALDAFPKARLELNAPCEDLVVEGGAVVGAIVRRNGKRIAVRSKKGVLIASGGFERNDEMRTQYGVPGSARDSMGTPGSLGKAIAAAIDIGADTDLMDQAWWSPGMTHPGGNSAFALWFTAGIFVNGQGKRFGNESGPYDRFGRDALQEMSENGMTLPYWMIYDDKSGSIPPVEATNVPMVEPEEYRAAGLWHTADSLEELAELIGVPADALAATVTRFNELVRKGVDEDFGRGDEPYDRAFFGDGSPLVAIEQKPFHAAAFGVSDLGTKGGLRTTPTAQVLDTAGDPIPGLYAAGNSMAAASGTVYASGGNPIGSSMIFSHLAVRDMLRG